MNKNETLTGLRHDVSERPLILSLAIVIIVMVSEVIGGILSNSLALIGDAGHMMVDGFALGLSFFAINIARRPATPRKTYGFQRVEIMAALANGIFLILISFYILYEAYGRFRSPPEVRTPIMLTVAVIGFLANIIMLFLLREERQNLNIRAAFWHVTTDTLSSVGVILGAIIITVTGWAALDPIIASLISLIIIWGAMRLISESVNILLEAVPPHIRTDDVIREIKKTPGVKDVHDIHIWTITSGVYALSSHLSIADQAVSDSTAIVAAVSRNLERDFGIRHTTIQVESETCPSGLVGGVCPLGVNHTANNIAPH